MAGETVINADCPRCGWPMEDIESRRTRNFELVEHTLRCARCCHEELAYTRGGKRTDGPGASRSE